MVRQRNPLNQALVDAHLESVPCLTTLTTRRLARCDFQVLGRQPHWALDAQVLGARALNEFAAYFLQRLDVTRGQRDADAVDFLQDRVASVHQSSAKRVEFRRTGPSPKSFSPFWYDMVRGE